ncbi:hypothetical protein CCR94_12195 [Rhodoblastus sphagnicola]|uniref:Glycosyltransferase 2-like domain-containing protein n=2 Tax=Rhodoblastus sphagnicola TaxID=333368 RepID=A0A2S6N7G6_9HYPH|nr:hypothetical protein CCR94_12195 [Rhodoblastus sphagnicola]
MHILSLTSTPPRFQYLPRFFANLMRQRAKPDRIELNIPINYRRFQGEAPTLPGLPDYVNVMRVDDDLGPATKVLPTAARWRDRNPFIVFCDDDQFYDKDWFGRLVELSRRRPADAICEQGGFLSSGSHLRRRPSAIERLREIKNLKYRLKRLATFLGLADSRRQFEQSGYVDLLHGYGGVCIRPNQFPAEAWSIPPNMFTEDDFWLSGMLNLNNVGIWLNAESKKPSVFRASSKKDPLMQINSAEHRCAEYMMQTYGVWA